MASFGSVALGHHAKVEINGVRFAVVGGELRFMVQEHDVTDTESFLDVDGYTWEDADAGLERSEATIEFQHLKDLNVHQVPLSLKPGRLISLTVYADGIDSEPYLFPKFLLGPGSRGLALRSPQAGRVQGRSVGPAFFPGDT